MHYRTSSTRASVTYFTRSFNCISAFLETILLLWESRHKKQSWIQFTKRPKTFNFKLVLYPKAEYSTETVTVFFFLSNCSLQKSVPSANFLIFRSKCDTDIVFKQTNHQPIEFRSNPYSTVRKPYPRHRNRLCNKSLC